jgi:hypothetical protein
VQAATSDRCAASPYWRLLKTPLGEGDDVVDRVATLSSDQPIGNWKSPIGFFGRLFPGDPEMDLDCRLGVDGLRNICVVYCGVEPGNASFTSHR